MSRRSVLDRLESASEKNREDVLRLDPREKAQLFAVLFTGWSAIFWVGVLWSPFTSIGLIALFYLVNLHIALNSETA